MIPEFTLPQDFVPNADAKSVKKLRENLRTHGEAVRLRVIVEPGDRDRDCYMNVQNRVDRSGGRMQLGWAVWQHDDLFIEAEPHAVFDPGNGQPWIDCTPHEGAPPEILFIPNDDTYDFNTEVLADNIRVPLRDDPRLARALRLYSEKIKLLNTVPGVNVMLPTSLALKVQQIQNEADMLLAEVIGMPASRQSPLVRAGAKVGRNDPCPCGSGKKYKKCCGQAA
jgi:hypothetical protein